jgi:acetolactate synthase-1/3 small subunit
MIIELTGTQQKVTAFIEMLGDYEILEIARTGIAGLRRGSDGVVDL